MNIKSTLNIWALHQVKGRLTDVTGPVGQIITFQGGGQTTMIEAVVCLDQHIVKTQSGSFYKLGTPNLAFAVRHPELLKQLGF